MGTIIANGNKKANKNDTRIVLLVVFSLLAGIPIFANIYSKPSSQNNTTASQFSSSFRGGRDVTAADTAIATKVASRICRQNPYLGTVADPVEKISQKMDEWLLQGRLEQGAMASDPIFNNHDHERFFPFTPTSECIEKQCIGGPCSSDDSKILCGLEQLNKNKNSTTTTTTTKANEKCIVYSIGGDNVWTFELDMLDKTPCEIHTFDCTGERSRFQVPVHPRLTFHHVCLTPYPQHDPASSRERPSYMVGESWTLLEMQQKLGHDRIDLLKVDIEGYELNMFHSWPILADFQASEQILLPMQIAVEIHYVTQFKDLHGGLDPFKTATELLELQTHLMRMGYIVTVRDDNPKCPHCTELTLLRVRCPGTGVYRNH
ncbi:hypothetical protein ACA910_019110 [Epithemia clementina (nom. ined.)]